MLHDVLMFSAHVVFLYFYEMYMLRGDIIFMFLFLFLVSHCATLIIDLCKVEFNQPSCWLYSVPNLLVF